MTWSTTVPEVTAPERGADEDGFTFIELMVVLLIMLALMAIAVPMYLGARNNANNTAAQSTLRIALETVDNYYESHGTFVGATYAALDQSEPALVFGRASDGGDQVGVITPAWGGRNWIVLTAKSDAGSCYWILQVRTDSSSIIGSSYFNSETITSAGTWYGHQAFGSGTECVVGLGTPNGWSKSASVGWGTDGMS